MKQFNYREKQLDRLTDKPSEFLTTIKLTNEYGKTNWLDITDKEFKTIKALLIKGD